VATSACSMLNRLGTGAVIASLLIDEGAILDRNSPKLARLPECLQRLYAAWRPHPSLQGRIHGVSQRILG